MVCVDVKHHVYLLWWMWQFICHSHASIVRKDPHPYPLPSPPRQYIRSSACAGCSLGTRLCSAATRDRARCVIVTALNSKYLEVSSADKIVSVSQLGFTTMFTKSSGLSFFNPGRPVGYCGVVQKGGGGGGGGG